MIATAEQLGIGLYTPKDAAFYARVPTQTLKRWVMGNKRGRPVVKREISDENDATITFLDFVQALAIRSIRTQFRKKVSLQKIREAADRASEKYGVEYPFARPHSTYVITAGSNVGEVVLRLDNEQLVQATGSEKDQFLIGPIAELYLDRLTFDDESKYAIEYRPMQSERAGAILMNPHRRFGEPLVEECGYSARALWEAVIAEGGIDAAATAYGVKPEHVKLAYEYFDYLLTASA